MQKIEIIMDKEKIEATKTLCRHILYQKYCQDMYLNNLRFGQPNILLDKLFVKYRQFFRVLFFGCAVYLIFAGFYSFFEYWGVDKNIIHLILSFLFFIGAVLFVLLFRYYDRVFSNELKKYQLKNFQKRLINFFSKTNSSNIFNSLKNQPLPFLAIYELYLDKIIYYRQYENTKNKIWDMPTKNYQGFYYLIDDNVCFIFKYKNSQNYKMFLFVDKENKPILENYFQELGLVPLQLTDENLV